MGLLSSYLMRTILTSTFMVMLVLLALAGLFEFISQLEDTQGNYGVPQALLFSVLRLPQLSFEMIPIAALIGSLLGLGGLANNSELVVMRTAGLSVARLAGMVAISGVVLVIFTAVIGEYIGPPLDYFARTMRDEGRYEQVDRDIGSAAWVKDGQVILHLQRINPEFEFGVLYMFRFNDDHTLSSIMVMLVLLALAGLFEFISQLEDTQGNYGVPQALLFSVLRLPQLSFEMIPIAALIGSLLGLGGLANNSELVVMRTAGLSVARLAGMVAISGVVLVIFTAVIGEYIGPPLDYFARTMRDEGRYEQVDRDIGSAAWVKDGQVILHLQRINPEFEFGVLYMFRFNDDHTLSSIARAENSGIDDSDKWILENFRETRFRDDGSTGR